MPRSYVAVCQDNMVGHFEMRAEHELGIDEDNLDSFAKTNCERGG